ncbi:MLO-like protein 12 [Quercus suber]|uniref:MLO-like protein 12 n=1 Tax=Quercus suber TaxID=58331 RepID=UPI000CE2298F|nr:MLO-like protein 12 [Quercus suber]POF01765.1 mlo-like protein 6 [Quercus suber]
MAGAEGGQSLEQTPTWAVAVVCFVLVVVSIIIEHAIHLIGKWLTKRHKSALYEALEKIKSELMILGFISLLLTVGQGPISSICITKAVGAAWHPCNKIQEKKLNKDEENGHRRLLTISDFGGGGNTRRVLAAAGYDKCADKGKVSFVSAKGIHQLHIFIFVLAVFHVLYCIITMALGKAKMGKWKAWEMETRTADYHFSNDPERFRFARDTSFGRRHLSFWSRSSVLLWTVCFFRQFFRSVPKVDYLTLRHGFIVAHLAPESRTKFNFQRYIKRSLEEDFKVVVGISPAIWFFAVLFLLFNTHGWYSYLWLPFLPLIIILLVGTKLQVIITMMGLRIEERGGVVKGTPLVQPGDDLFWFNRPRLIIYLIHFVLFQNAFQLAFFVWTWHQFGLKSCFHEKLEDVIIRISMGVLIQILCSYVTLPLYALVTQMGSTMKPTIFNERVANALRKWHHKAKKNIKQNQHSTSTPVTPMHSMSPVHLLHHYQGELDSIHKTQRMSNFNNEGWDMNGPHSSSHHHDQISMPKNQRNHGQEESSSHEPSSIHSPSSRHSFHVQHESDVHSIDFSFDNT